jgi:hypothetical protein
LRAIRRPFHCNNASSAVLRIGAYNSRDTPLALLNLHAHHLESILPSFAVGQLPLVRVPSTSRDGVESANISFDDSRCAQMICTTADSTWPLRCKPCGRKRGTGPGQAVTSTRKISAERSGARVGWTGDVGVSGRRACFSRFGRRACGVQCTRCQLVKAETSSEAWHEVDMLRQACESVGKWVPTCWWSVPKSVEKVDGSVVRLETEQ